MSSNWYCFYLLLTSAAIIHFIVNFNVSTYSTYIRQWADVYKTSYSTTSSETKLINTNDMQCKLYVYNISQLQSYYLKTNSSIMYTDWNQNNLPDLFNNVLLNHPLRTYNISDADLFYLPFSESQCPNDNKNTCHVTHKGKKTLKLYFDIHSLIRKQNGEIKIKNNISNHFMVLWRPNGIYRFRDWFKNQPLIYSANFTKLTVENEWEYYDQGWLQIPYITNYIDYPNNPIEQFIDYKQIKKYFISGIFNARSIGSDCHKNGEIRHALMDQCANVSDSVCLIAGAPKKKYTTNGTHIEAFMDIYRQSKFSLQPEGDTMTRKGVFDALVLGAIPVIFDVRTFNVDPLFEMDFEKYPIYVLIDVDDVVSGKINVIETLESIKEEEIEIIKQNIKYFINRVRYYDYRYRYSIQYKDDVIDWILNYLCRNVKGMVTNDIASEHAKVRQKFRYMNRCIPRNKHMVNST
eukprot:166299_1